MAIPDFQTVMRPVLAAVASGLSLIAGKSKHHE